MSRSRPEPADSPRSDAPHYPQILAMAGSGFGNSDGVQSVHTASKPDVSPPSNISNSAASGASRLEAMLFLSRQPLTSRKLAQLAGLADGTKARTLVRLLNERYDAEGRAFRVEEVAGGYQLMTRSKFAPWLRRLHATPAELRLSAPVMETLAVVAYRQPILRVEIEAIRGVQSGEVLRQLIERDLVRIAGRSSELGRPFLYGTTKTFLQAFGLRHLDELPRSESLRMCGPNFADKGSIRTGSDSHNQETPNQPPVAEEEENVKTLTMPRRIGISSLGEDIAETRYDDLDAGLNVVNAKEEDEDFEDEDFDDDEEDEEEDEDLDDEPWEEVEDEDEDDEDPDDDEDDEWDDDEEDDEWDDEDWEDDDDEDDDEEEEKKEDDH